MICEGSPWGKGHAITCILSMQPNHFNLTLIMMILEAADIFTYFIVSRSRYENLNVGLPINRFLTKTENRTQIESVVDISLTPEDDFSKFMYSLGVLLGTLHPYIQDKNTAMAKIRTMHPQFSQQAQLANLAAKRHVHAFHWGNTWYIPMFQ